MLKALKTLIGEVRRHDQRSLALELALEECGQLGRLVKTIGVGPTLLLIKGFAGQTLQIPDFDNFSATLEAAAAATELSRQPELTLRKRYSSAVLEKAATLRKKLDEVEQARQVLVQKMNSQGTS